MGPEKKPRSCVYLESEGHFLVSLIASDSVTQNFGVA